MSYLSQPLKRVDKPSAITDDLLVKQAVAGDQRSFEALVRKYERPLRGYIWNILKDEDLMADVLQHVFFQLSLSLPSLKTSSPLKAWLFRVSYHRCLDELRKQKRRRAIFFSQLEADASEEEPFFAEMIPDEQPTPEEILEWHDLRNQLLRALNVLSPLPRAIVSLRSFGELSFAEIGKRLNIPETTAKTYFHRSLPRLRAVMSSSREAGEIRHYRVSKKCALPA